MKKQIVRKLSRREVTDVYVCEYDTPLFQAFLAYAEAFILYIIAMILGSGASSSDTNNHYCVRINGIMYPLAARNVSIAVGCYVIQVRIMAPIAITNSAVLYALALYNLANSPDLLQLPRWMVRKIRRKARRVHFISSTFSCADLASMPHQRDRFFEENILSEAVYELQGGDCFCKTYSSAWLRRSGKICVLSDSIRHSESFSHVVAIYPSAE